MTHVTDYDLAFAGWTDSVDNRLMNSPWDGLCGHPITITELHELFDAGVTPEEAAALLDYLHHSNYEACGISHERWDELEAQFDHVIVSADDACAYDGLGHFDDLERGADDYDDADDAPAAA